MSRFRLGDVTLEFVPPAVETERVPAPAQPLSSTNVDQAGNGPQSKHPGYSALFGGQLPKFTAPKE